MKTKVKCAYCGKKTAKENGQITRAKSRGLELYCNRKCSGLGRRDTRTKAEKVEAKRIYDMEYRAKNAEMLRQKKREYFVKTYDPAKAAVERKKTMARHVEYCRRPEYREWKKAYDQQYRAKKDFGEFWEAALTLLDIEKEVDTRISRVDVYRNNGTLNKKQTRRRDYDRLISNQS